MNQPQVVAIADDFSGATEIAGVAYAAGLTVTLSQYPNFSMEDSEVRVIDTDTRSKTESEAAKIHQIVASRVGHLSTCIYKKTDSVLRGHIFTELNVLKLSLSKKRILFSPANPDRKRVIRNGKYTINGTPLHQSEFANDPNFPTKTDVVAQAICKNGNELDASWSIPDIATTQDLLNAAATLKASTLPAGASPFFSALLQTKKLVRAKADQKIPPNVLTGTTLLVSGSFSEVSKQTAKQFEQWNRPVIRIDPREDHVPDQGLLETSPVAMIKLADEVLPEPTHLPHFIADCLEYITMPDHIMIEGGDTAAAILKKFQWHSFKVIHQWEPGVTTLQPNHPNSPIITIKPGSYPWPDQIFVHK